MNKGEKRSPELRFKGFFDDWEKHKIKNIITDIKRPLIMDNDKEYQLVTVKRRNAGVVSRGWLKGKDILVKNYSRLKKGDYLISKRQVVHGANGIVPIELDNAIVSNEYLVITSNEKITTQFLSLLSLRPHMYKMFFLSSYGVDIEKLVFNVADWKKRELFIPSISEQIKIVDLFNKLDYFIELEERKLEVLEKQKKGYMQKVFSQELRFKDENGDNYPDWKVEKLGNIATIHRGLTYKPSDISKEGVRVLRSSNILDNTFYLHKDDVFVNEKKVKLSFVQKDDILITAANGSPRLVGKHALINRNIKKAVPGGFMYLMKSETPQFIQVWMKTREYKKLLTLVQGGNGSIGNLSRKDLENAKISLPIKEEREKIGGFFMEFDKLVNKHKDKVKHLQRRKHSLLQKMFI